jgi:hypothetical protein
VKKDLKVTEREKNPKGRMAINGFIARVEKKTTNRKDNMGAWDNGHDAHSNTPDHDDIFS